MRFISSFPSAVVQLRAEKKAVSQSYNGRFKWEFFSEWIPCNFFLQLG
jgi:hypothetical protein